MKKILLISSAMLLFGCLVVGLAVALGALNAPKTTQNRHSAEGLFDSVSITAGDADLTIAVSENGSAYAICYENEKVTYTLSVEDGTLYFREHDTRKWYEYIYFGFNISTRKVTLYLPEGEYAALLCEHGSGVFSCTDQAISFRSATLKSQSGDAVFSLDIKEEMSITTSSANITLSDLTAEKIILRTVSGDVTITHVAAGGISLKTNSGSIKLTDAEIAGSARFGAVSGDIKVSNTYFAKTLEIETSSGTVRLSHTVADEGASVATSSGDIFLDHFDASEINLTASSGNIKGSLLTKKFFQVSTSSGSVKVPASLEGADKCTVTTQSGNISLSIDEN